ncbi:hypothetical protein ACFQQB_18665 [Nonomuraea rubra]|uniref:hypothetical protein n=1 Tax=Nonomuraea rubra TaxID=46180 RepID=UPI00361CF4A7
MTSQGERAVRSISTVCATTCLWNQSSTSCSFSGAHRCGKQRIGLRSGAGRFAGVHSSGA